MRHPLYALLLLPIAGILALVFRPRAADGTSYVPDLPQPAAVSAAYDKDTIYDYMDGGAEVFNQNGFISLKVWTGKSGKSEWTAELYLFGSSAQAEKIYQQFKGDAQTRFDGAVYAPGPGSATTHAGSFYFKVFTYPEDNALSEKAVRQFLRWFHEQNA